jgi:HEAT repeat protein
MRWGAILAVLAVACAAFLAIYVADDAGDSVGPSVSPHEDEPRGADRAAAAGTRSDGPELLGDTSMATGPLLSEEPVASPPEREDRRIQVAISALKSGPYASRREALGAIREIGAPSIPRLLDLLREGDGEQKKWALFGLEVIDPLADQTVIGPLTECLDDPDLRGIAYRVFGKLGPLAGPAIPVLVDRLADEHERTALIGALKVMGPGVVKPTIEAADSRNVGERRAAVSVLAQMRDETSNEVLEALARALRDRDTPVRMLAIDGLSVRGEAARPVLDDVRGVLNDPESVVRRKAKEIVKNLDPQ